MPARIILCKTEERKIAIYERGSANNEALITSERGNEICMHRISVFFDPLFKDYPALPEGVNAEEIKNVKKNLGF